MTTEITLDNLENITDQETVPVVVQHNHLTPIFPIAFFSFIGVLIRIGLGFLGNAHAPLSAAFWPNFIGCLIMGFIVEQKLHMQNKFAELYAGLTTGLCGSITTFSGLMYYSCVALFGPSSHFGYPVSNYFALIISALSASVVGFIIGRHMSIFILPPSSSKTVVLILKFYMRTWLFLGLTIVIIPVVVALAVVLPTGRNTYFIYSVIFAPFGSLTRYFLSIMLNRNSNFPLGTLIANLTGSYIYFGMVAINEYVHPSSLLIKQIINGVIQGYCGCLTTVSTFILELDTIKKVPFLYAYILFTILPIQIVYIILGDIFSSLCSPT